MDDADTVVNQPGGSSAVRCIATIQLSLRSFRTTSPRPNDAHRHEIQLSSSLSTPPTSSTPRPSFRTTVPYKQAADGATQRRFWCSIHAASARDFDLGSRVGPLKRLQSRHQLFCSPAEQAAALGVGAPSVRCCFICPVPPVLPRPGLSYVAQGLPRDWAASEETAV